MTQDYINNNKIKENKYKILRMSLILGSDENREETINNFEESAREIDAMNDETYLRDLEDKFYDTLKLEEEEKKLAVLVDYIGGRVEQRISLLSDFANITGYDLSNLPPIKYYDKLDDYKERLKYIREYLSNTEQINKLTEEIDDSELKLEEAYKNKATSEEHNNKNEEALLNKFTNIINSIDELKDINEDNIDSKLNDTISIVEESKKSLDIFVKSYTTLSETGISYDEKEEYKSYVDNAKDVYYVNKEQEYLLKIYSLLLTKEIEYSKILNKREILNSIIYERENLRADLNINKPDILNSVYDMVERQFNDINLQKDNIEAIDYLSRLIQNKKEERNTLEHENQKVEILSLLREFCIIDTYSEIEENTINETEEIISPDNVAPILNAPEEPITTESADVLDGFTIEPTLEIPEMPDMPTLEPIPDVEKTLTEPAKDNQVIAIENATNIDLELINSKASKVMKRVGEMLGIKTEETTIVSVTAEELPKEENKEPVVEAKEEIPTQSLPDENPLFSNNLSSMEETPADPEDQADFWFPSDTPDALNELPDLEISNNNTFFGDNAMPDLNFPDLKLDFGPNESEGN